MGDLVVKARLSDEEDLVLKKYMESGKPPISISFSLKLYELYIRGSSCQELASLNPGLDLGAILRARVEHRWDERRDAHLASLYTQASDILRQNILESVNFISVAMAATHKRIGDQLKRYLQTGDENDLPDQFNVSNIKQYKDLVETLMKISGAENKKEVRHTGHVESTTTVVPVPGVSQITPDAAAKILALIAKEDDGNTK